VAKERGDTRLVHVFLQGGGIDKRDWGLLHTEEDVLDASSAHGADRVSSRRGALHSSKAMVLAIAATAVVVRISRSAAEGPGSSTQARNDEASTCSITRYVLPASS